jgi:hypothetical protein
MEVQMPNEFIRRHMPLIVKYSKSRRFRPWFVEPEEFCSDLILCIAEGYSDFRTNSKSRPCRYCEDQGCETWIGWRARLTRTRAMRKRRVWLKQEPVEAIADAPHAGKSIHVTVAVLEVLRKADSEEYQAALSVLEGYTGKEVKEKLGITVAGRNYRLKKLGERLGAGAR